MPVYGMLGHAMRSEEAWTGDRTTLVGEDTLKWAYLAAGCALAALRAAAKTGQHSFAVCRPPGHHLRRPLKK